MEKNNITVADVMKQALIRPCAISKKSDGQSVIAIVNSYMELSPGDLHLNRVAGQVRQGVIESGGFPVELTIPSFCGELKRNSSVRKYYFSYRDFATAMVEFLINFHDFDGAVFLCTCDNQVPAFVMGALRCNLPSVFVTGGYMPPGDFNGEEITVFSVGKQYARYQKGKYSKADFESMLDCACPGPGACPEMGTANTMGILTEAMGLSLPGCASVPAGSDRQMELAYRSGRQVVECVKSNLKPSDIIDKRALKNMIRVCMAIGGSTNAVIHNIAYAKEIDCDLSLEDWDRISRETPLICSISPNQQGFYMPHFERCGGVAAVMKVLEQHLYLEGRRVSGKTLGEDLADVKPNFNEVLRPLTNPFMQDGGLRVMKGNLAPLGGIIKTSAIPQGLRYFKGPAKVFDREEDANAAVENDEIQPGDVIVVRYEGPSAGPGSREVVAILHMLVGKGLANKVAVITDGRQSGTNLGLSVCNISPEANTGTAMAVVRHGDIIEINIDQGKLNLLIPEDEIKNRLSRWVKPEPQFTKGVLALYGKNVGQLCDGARII